MKRVIGAVVLGIVLVALGWWLVSQGMTWMGWLKALAWVCGVVGFLWGIWALMGLDEEIVTMPWAEIMGESESASRGGYQPTGQAEPGDPPSGGSAVTKP